MGAGRTTGVFLESLGEVVTDSTVTSIRWLPVSFMHALVAIALTYPLVTELGSSFVVSPGDESGALYRNFYVWRWQADRIGRFFSEYWAAPIHHPATDALAYFDTQPLSGLLFAGLERLSGNEVLAFNAVILVYLTLNGVAFTALARALKVGWGSAMALGILGQASPVALAHLGDPTLIVSFPLVFGIATIGRFSVTGELRWAMAVGLCLLMAYGTSSALLVAMSIVIPILALLLPVGRRWFTTLGNLLPVLVGTVVVMAYPLWRQSRALEGAIAREGPSVASMGDWFLAAQGSLLQRFELLGEASDRFVLYPGLVLTGLALVGIGLGYRTHRRWVLAATMSALVAFIFTLGGQDAGNTAGAVDLMTSIHPGLDRLRHREIFATVTHAMLIGLAAVTFARLEPPRLHVRRRLALTVLALGVLEGVALPATVVRPPAAVAQPWMVSLDGREPAAIAHVGPSGFGSSWQDVHDTLIHRLAIVGAPTTFIPPETRAIEERLTDFPTADGVRHLRARGVGTLVVAKVWLTKERARILEAADGAEVAFEDDSVRVYALAPATVKERELDATGPAEPEPEATARPRKNKKKRTKRRSKRTDSLEE